MKLLSILLTTLSLTSLATSRCTREDNTSFVLSPWNNTTPAFASGWQIALGAKNPTNPSLPRDVILKKSSSTNLLPFFKDRGIWIYQTGSRTKTMRGFMYKVSTDPQHANKGWKLMWASEAEIKKLDQTRVKKEFFDIGCVYDGRHFLMFNGVQKWQVCRPWGKGDYLLMHGVTNPGLQCTDSVNFWVDYVRPV